MKFYLKLSRALDLLETEDLLAKSPDLQKVATDLTGDAAAKPNPAMQQKQQEQQAMQQKKQQLAGAKKKVDDAQRQTDDAESKATAKQDPALFNAASSKRKRLESDTQAYNIQLQKALGQQPNPNTTAGMPPGAVL